MLLHALLSSSYQQVHVIVSVRTYMMMSASMRNLTTYIRTKRARAGAADKTDDIDKQSEREREAP